MGNEAEGDTMENLTDTKDLTKNITGNIALCGEYPMGLIRTAEGFHVSVTGTGKKCAMLLFRAKEELPFCRIFFPEESRVGDVWSMEIGRKEIQGISGTSAPEDADFPEDTEYAFEDDTHIFPDPCAENYSGHETWKKKETETKGRRSPLFSEKFDWEGDRPLGIPYEESIFYKIHVRGFTESVSGKVKGKGTFEGITEKIPYLKELGVTAAELMPCQEFEENVLYPDGKPTGKVNYWGYTKDVFRFAPKAGYCRMGGEKPSVQFKTMVKKMHQAGLEVIPEIYFEGSEPVTCILSVLRHWVSAFHVDGIHLVGSVPAEHIAADPYLTGTKLLFDHWDNAPCGRIKHLASCNEGFEQDMRRFLKGDEGMISRLVFHTKNNPKNAASVNFMANTNGFTMMDMVSYDIRHNEENGENNADGTENNFSWNCGAEGPVKKKKITELRSQQIRNAFLLLFLSQGTPLILSGDEFGQTKLGNNNSWCQDNGISWLNWKLVKANADILAFVKHVIAFRKRHPVFHYPEEPKVLDTLAKGLPDISYHGVSAWRPEFENWRRQLGILYCGEYATLKNGGKDQSFYVLYNMHWEAHDFALPNPEKGFSWFLSMDTSDGGNNGFCPIGEETLLPDQKIYNVNARTIAVLVEKPDPSAASAEETAGNKKKKAPEKRRQKPGRGQAEMAGRAEVKQDSTKQDAVKQDGVKQDGVKQDAVKQDSVKQKPDGETIQKLY